MKSKIYEPFFIIQDGKYYVCPSNLCVMQSIRLIGTPCTAGIAAVDISKARQPDRANHF